MASVCFFFLIIAYPCRGVKIIHKVRKGVCEDVISKLHEFLLVRGRSEIFEAKRTYVRVRSRVKVRRKLVFFLSITIRARARAYVCAIVANKASGNVGVGSLFNGNGLVRRER